MHNSIKKMRFCSLRWYMPITTTRINLFTISGQIEWSLRNKIYFIRKNTRIWRGWGKTYVVIKKVTRQKLENVTYTIGKMKCCSLTWIMPSFTTRIDMFKISSQIEWSLRNIINFIRKNTRIWRGGGKTYVVIKKSLIKS